MIVMPSIGDDFGRYRLTRELGRGGMGVVFAAHDSSLDREVALKIIAPQLAADDDFRARFRREALALSRIDSPHVVTVHDHGELDGCLYLVTQLVPDGDLLQHVRRVGALGPQLALDLAGQLLAGLADAHAAGVVHRDVKPSNVLLRARDGHLEAVLCDFGIATTADGQLTRTGALVGSFPYMAPERHQGETAEAAADLYSVGCLLWHLLTGTPPFAGTDVEVAIAHLQAPVPQLPQGSAAAAALNRVLLRSMAKRPEDRYPSARAMRADLATVVDLLGPAPLVMPDVTAVRHALTPGVVVPPGPAAPDRRTRRRAALVAASVAGLLALSGGLYAVLALSPDDETPVQVEAVVDASTATGTPGLTTPATPATTSQAPTSPGTRGPSTKPTAAPPAQTRDPAPAVPGNGGSSPPRTQPQPQSQAPQTQAPQTQPSAPQPTRAPTRDPQPTRTPTPNPAPSSTPSPTPQPQPTWRCWDGTAAFAYDDCSRPTGRAGLRWMFGDIARLSCYDADPSARGRGVGITCTIATGKGPATVYFLEWSSGAAARAQFDSEDSQAAVWRNAWGYSYYWVDRKGSSAARLYADVPFSMRVKARNNAQRKGAIARLDRFRSPKELRGERI